MFKALVRLCLLIKKYFLLNSLQPCIHSFCAACYSQWMNRSSDCPSVSDFYENCQFGQTSTNCHNCHLTSLCGASNSSVGRVWILIMFS